MGRQVGIRSASQTSIVEVAGARPGGLAASVVFPSPSAMLVPAPLHSVTSTALLRLSCGPLWMLKSRGHAWTEQRLVRAAALLEHAHAGRAVGPQVQDLRDGLDMPALDIAAPDLNVDVTACWNVRAVALALCMRDLEASRPRSALAAVLPRFTAELQGQIAAQLQAAVNEFANARDPAAQAIASQYEDGPTIYNHLVYGPARRNRMQLAGALPLFVDALARNRADRAFDVLRATVDTGGPLLRTICHLFNVSPSTVRCLFGVPVSDVDAQCVRNPRILLATLDRLAPGERPRLQHGEWPQFIAAMREAASLFKCPASVGVLTASWVRHRMRETDEQRMGPDMLTFFDGDIASQVETFRLALISTASQVALKTHAGPSDVVSARATSEVDQLLTALSLRRLAQTSIGWHCDYATRRDTMALQQTASRRVDYWPLMTDPYVSTRFRVTMQALSTRQSLQSQGKALQQCLADSHLNDIDRRCRAGESYVVSVTDSASGTPLSTAEFVVKGHRDDPRLDVVVKQHTGPSNRRPPMACAHAISELRDHLMSAEAQRHLRTGFYAIAKPKTDGAQQASERELAARIAAFGQAMGQQQFDELVQRITKGTGPWSNARAVP